MIFSFKHKGLKKLYENDDKSGIRPDLLARVQDILARLDVCDSLEEMNLPAYRLHQLKGNLKGYWSVTVRANWRIIFRFAGQYAYEIELVDYH